MTYDKTQSIDAFLAAMAAKQPVPGGGATAALAGALAAALGEMVVNYSVGKKDLAEHQDVLTFAVGEFARARAVMLELMVEDQAAYQTLSDIRKAGKPRSDELDAALAVCIRVPESIGATATAVLKLCDSLATKVNKYLLSDLAICAELAMATVRCAAYNVRVNLADVHNPSEKYRIDSAVTQQIADASRMIQRLMPKIWGK